MKPLTPAQEARERKLGAQEKGASWRESVERTAPTPHSHTTLDQLERDVATRKAEHRAACAVLGALWDRSDAGEGGLDDETETARLAAGVASDALDDARAAFVAEWKRVGSPLDRQVDRFDARYKRATR